MVLQGYYLSLQFFYNRYDLSIVFTYDFKSSTVELGFSVWLSLSVPIEPLLWMDCYGNDHEDVCFVFRV